MKRSMQIMRWLSAVVLVMAWAAMTPEADGGGRGRGGSVRHSSGGHGGGGSSRSRSAQPRSSNRGNASPGNASTNRGNTNRGNANTNRGNANRDTNVNRGGDRNRANVGSGNTINNVNVNAPRRGGAGYGAGGSYRAGYRHGAARGYNAGRWDSRYSHWDDARSDWMRYRTVNHLITAGTYVATRPRGYSTVYVSGSPYYYSGGVYYVSSGTRYVVINPPTTVVVQTIPAQSTIVYTSDQTQYYYAGGTYYAPTDKEATPMEASPDEPASQTVAGASGGAEPEPETETQAVEKEEGEPNYEVVTPPVGVTVPYLPEGAKEKTIDGSKYYTADGAYYQPFSNGGTTIYMVVEDPTAGA